MENHSTVGVESHKPEEHQDLRSWLHVVGRSFVRRFLKSWILAVLWSLYYLRHYLGLLYTISYVQKILAISNFSYYIGIETIVIYVDEMPSQWFNTYHNWESFGFLWLALNSDLYLLISVFQYVVGYVS